MLQVKLIVFVLFRNYLRFIVVLKFFLKEIFWEWWRNWSCNDYWRN